MAQPRRMQTPSADTGLEWEHAIPVILELAQRDPERAWRTSELVDALPDLTTMAIVMAITDAHRRGLLRRVGVATYQAPAEDPAATAAANERHLWGTANP